MLLPALLSLAAALIHAAILPDHWGEMWQHGFFMLAATVGQAAGTILLLHSPRPWVLLATLTGNLFIILIAVWAYTAGLPEWLYGDGPEALNLPVVVCTALEVLLVLLCGLRLRTV